ncbi:MAG: hypothetical protein HY287_17965 [Planctomycetes bacterium]|nr:hypothetical protein [Planctomycetota bacterium]MBI3836211.1 hypothetical protein [Planctomycetota bacterium]
MTVCIAESPVNSTGSFESRAHAIQSRLDELIDRDDLAHSLHFGWFDRPYAKAMMAIAFKIASVAERELTLRKTSREAMTDEQLDAMLSWCETAISRAALLPCNPDFRPDRIRFERKEFLMLQVPPLWAFVDDASATRADADWGDMDLLAAIGQKIYVPARLSSVTQQLHANTVFDSSSDDTPEPREEDLSDVPELAVPKPLRQNTHSMSIQELARRAASLGMGFAISYSPPPAAQNRANEKKVESLGFQITARTLRELIENSSTNPQADVLEAGSDATEGESIGGWLARRALMRGANGKTRTAVINWRSPAGFPAESPQAIRAAMWIAALDGQQIALLNGWRDLRDGRIHREPSIFLSADVLEAQAHTALDMLRFAPIVRAFDQRPSLAIVIDSNVISAQNSNQWANWILPLFDRLTAINIHFDVIPVANAQSLEHSGRYANVLTPRPNSLESPAVLDQIVATVVSKFDQKDFPRAYDNDGNEARQLYFRIADSGGHLFIAIINECDRPRTIRLSTAAKAKSFHDLLMPTNMLMRLDKIDLAAWQVRILEAQ